MVSLKNEENGIYIIEDEDVDGFFICDDDFAFIISKMVERMNYKIKKGIRKDKPEIMTIDGIKNKVIAWRDMNFVNASNDSISRLCESLIYI